MNAHLRRMKARLDSIERMDLDEPEYDALDLDERNRLGGDAPTKSLYKCGDAGSTRNVDWSWVNQGALVRKRHNMPLP